jgi:predicted kinase
MSNLYLICGMSGAGKTTLAKKLESNMSAVRLCGDEFISVIIKDKNDKEELDRLRNPIEQVMWDLTKKLLAVGVNVILDNGFWSQEERLHYLSSARQLNSSAKVFLHYLDIPTEIIWNRINKRNFSLPSDCFHITRNDLDQWMRWFTPPDQDEIKLYDGYEVHYVNS